MTKAAVSKLENVKLLYLGYVLDDKSQGEQIYEELNQEYSNLLTPDFYNTSMDETLISLLSM